MEQQPGLNRAPGVNIVPSEILQKPKNYLVEGVKKFTRSLALIFALAAPAAPTASADNSTEHLNRDEITEAVQGEESSTDPYLLVLQQQIRDLQESGEMKIKTEEEKARGVYLPFDAGYKESADAVSGSGTANGVQKISIENATPEQIKNWEGYMKDKDGWIEEQRILAEKNKEGRRE